MGQNKVQLTVLCNEGTCHPAQQCSSLMELYETEDSNNNGYIHSFLLVFSWSLMTVFTHLIDTLFIYSLIYDKHFAPVVGLHKPWQRLYVLQSLGCR